MTATGLTDLDLSVPVPVVRNFHLLIVLAGIALGITAPLTAVFATALGASPALAGTVVAAMPAVTLSMNVFGTRWLPYLEPRRALTLALLIFGAGAAVTALAPSVLVIALARAAQGLGTVMFIAVGPQLAVRAAEAGAEGRALGSFNAAWFLGVSLGPITGGSLVGIALTGVFGGIPQLGIRLAFAVCALMSVLSSALIFLSLPKLTPTRTPRLGRPHIPEFASSRNVAVLVLGGLGQTLRSGLVMTLMPLIAVEHFGFHGVVLGLVLTVVAVFDVLAMYVSGNLADRIGRLPAVTLGVGIGVIGAMVGFHAVESSSLTQYIVASALLGTAVGTGWVVPVVSAVDVALTPESGLAAYRIAADIGMGVGSIAVGVIVGSFGFGGAFFAVITVLIACVILAAFIGETATISRPNSMMNGEIVATS